uniref:Uncharacterized protein n=1 Tax=Avena sativa TaxID=4498 RepID=A0ACD5TCM4_AVESA
MMMAGGFMGKRKELEQVVDGLSDFSLSAPAAKSRRLDPGLPPILEEPPAHSIQYQHEMLGGEISSGVTVPIVEDMIDGTMPCHLSSEDMALVLYKPVNKPALLGLNIASPSIIVSSDLIRGLKSKLIMTKLLLCLDSSSACLLFIQYCSTVHCKISNASWISNVVDKPGYCINILQA